MSSPLAVLEHLLPLHMILLGALLPGVCFSAAPPTSLKQQDQNSPSVSARLAAESLKPGALAREWKSIVLHHSATSGGTLEAIDAEHRQRRDAQGKPWLGIGYHFVIGNGEGMADGLIEPTFRWRGQLQGAHAGKLAHNERGIGICLIGNFEEDLPTARQLASVRQLVAELRASYHIDAKAVVAHRDLAATNCPGRKITLQDILPVETSKDESSLAAP